MTPRRATKNRSALLTVVFFALVSSSAYAQTPATSCVDVAGHQASLIDTGNGIQIETLDWGGSGPPIVFLSGLGNTAHIFDDFAVNFSPEYRVVALSRRGFGASSKPETGYTTADRSGDVIGVLDALQIESATIVGHSIAGDELSFLGVNFPDRVNGLIYLDAFDYGDGALMEAFSTMPPDAMAFDTPTARDSLSTQHFRAYMHRTQEIQFPLSEICAQWNVDADAHLINMTASSMAMPGIMGGLHESEFEKISTPVLGIFAPPASMLRDEQRATLSPEVRRQFNATERKFHFWRADQLNRFETRLPDPQVHVLESAHHYVFISNSRETVQLMLDFLEENR